MFDLRVRPLRTPVVAGVDGREDTRGIRRRDLSDASGSGHARTRPREGAGGHHRRGPAQVPQGQRGRCEAVVHETHRAAPHSDRCGRDRRRRRQGGGRSVVVAVLAVPRRDGVGVLRRDHPQVVAEDGGVALAQLRTHGDGRGEEREAAVDHVAPGQGPREVLHLGVVSLRKLRDTELQPVGDPDQLGRRRNALSGEQALATVSCRTNSDAFRYQGAILPTPVEDARQKIQDEQHG
mmetsp:Transcript_24900/g.49535  ORF Transcript_24900/g.49535 Transcript_24900/m.49535 type:complete len:236 (+) Transcript_24900:444-1151(+)